MSSREIVLQMLLQTIEEGGFSHQVLKQTLSAALPDVKEQVFILRLFHGVLEKQIFLDWIVQSYSNTKLEKMKPVIRNILRMSIYQMLFMDAVPDHAAINEAVNLAAKKGYKGLCPFVNGVLRSFQRGGIKPGMPQNVRHSAPLWMYKRLVRELGKKRADAFFDTSSEPKDVLFARMALSGNDPEEILSSLEEEGCKAERVEGIPEALKLRHVNRLTELTAFQKGRIFIQDLSSMQVVVKAAEYAEAENVKRILDVCAAPGGKSLHAADRFPAAEVISRDLTEEKVRLIDENIKRSRLSNIRSEVHDALVPDEALAKSADIVIADLPCSGIGVIGRKPDIKLRLREEDIKDLAALQREILNTAAEYVKEGGLLLYSTCTICREENEENTAWFLKEKDFELLYENQWIPGPYEGDGFYLAVMKKTI